MLNSSNRHLEILSWLNTKKDITQYTHLQLEKFLYFYEMFNMVDNKTYNIKGLKAYENGPVYSNVYGDYVYNREELFNRIRSINSDSNLDSNDNLVKSRFLIETLNDNDLSYLTHQLDMWKCKEKEIKMGVKQIPIYERDITINDKKMLEQIKSGCMDVSNYEVINILDKRFLIDKNIFSNFKREHYQTLEKLSNVEDLDNPVYIDMSEEGVLLVD
ncbi:hypothetical protein [Oceanivirga miroungae]|uniref:Antitoxin SocA-like Panacea domain-containing protein n=1 Tax=Oceanivirga miroungae TaxID=1130046 RepID=A0A6I8M9I4_9FUSO|nr:hypothetical protein [Oceanivirga miroungae]VWL84955.1 hypothetical protein OMES3154_00227 [Oceanivirga miroungae]